MGQEFTIKSETVEAKINQLLPSQGGYGAGVDISASTMIVPIIDLTETASGSVLREDLQRSVSKTGSTFQARNSTASLSGITPGFWRLVGTLSGFNEATNARTSTINITDGISTTAVWTVTLNNNSQIQLVSVPIDLTLFIRAGDSVNAVSQTNQIYINGYYRQIADIYGNLINPPGFNV